VFVSENLYFDLVKTSKVYFLAQSQEFELIKDSFELQKNAQEVYKEF